MSDDRRIELADDVYALIEGDTIELWCSYCWCIGEAPISDDTTGGEMLAIIERMRPFASAHVIACEAGTLPDPTPRWIDPEGTR